MSKRNDKPSDALCLHHGRWVTSSFVRISARYFYVDRARFWLKTAPSAELLGELRDHCLGRVMVFDKKNLEGGWAQKIELLQPTSKAFEALSGFKKGEIMINYVELAFDVIVASRHEASRLQEIATTHWYQPHHGDQKYNNFRGTEYSGARSARNNLVAYSDKPCKVTGEVHCAHFEWRVKEVSAVRARGIRTFKDLVDFDHLAFWEKNMRLYWIPLERLGRLDRDRYRKAKRRSSPLVDYGNGIKVCPDSRWGRLMMMEACEDENGYRIRDDATTQQVIDRYGAIGRKACVPIPTDWILKNDAVSMGLQC